MFKVQRRSTGVRRVSREIRFSWDYMRSLRVNVSELYLDVHIFTSNWIDFEVFITFFKWFD